MSLPSGRGTVRRTAALTALAAALLGHPVPAAAAPAAPGGTPVAAAPTPVQQERKRWTKAELERLRAELDEATRRAEQAAQDVFAAATRHLALRHEMDRLAEEQEQARAALDARVRALYMRGRPDPLTQMLLGLSAPDLAIFQRGLGAVVATDEQLIAGVRQDSLVVKALRLRAERVRRDLLARAQPVLEAQEQARRLLAEAEEAYRRDQAALAALAAQRARLNTLSADLTLAVAPAVTARGRRAQAAEEPVIRLLEATGRGMPPGYRATGQRITGIASWYGPGFVGNPTASGSPYDPERLTAAMLPPIPLGTVVRVTSEDGLAINVLVNDRGPYGKGRVIDLSRAGARWMGFTGLKKVTVEVLEPVR